MFAYYLRLGLRSLRRNPVLSALMVLAVALGIGVSMTSLTVFYLMSGNPVAHKNDVLYAVQLDSWGALQPFAEPNEPPNQLTHRDAVAIVEAGEAKRQIVQYRTAYPLQALDEKVAPFSVLARLTLTDFFPMFDVPFQFGSGWSAEQDESAARVVVLSRGINERVFGGANSVGERIRLGSEEFTVVGVLDHWLPTPKFYDVVTGPFDEPEDIYVPYWYGIRTQADHAGSTQCWNEPGAGFEGLQNSECIWHQVWVELESPSDAARYKAFLDSYANEQKALGRFARPLNNQLRTVSEWLENQRVVSRDSRVQVWLSFSFLAVCLINMIGLLLAKFIGRAGEIGLRRAVGANRREVFTQYLTEAGMVGLTGGLLGLLLTWLGLIGVRVLYADFERLAQLDWVMVLSTIAIAVTASLLAGLYPTWRACQIQPATQLKTQ